MSTELIFPKYMLLYTYVMPSVASDVGRRRKGDSTKVTRSTQSRSQAIVCKNTATVDGLTTEDEETSSVFRWNQSNLGGQLFFQESKNDENPLLTPMPPTANVARSNSSSLV